MRCSAGNKHYTAENNELHLSFLFGSYFFSILCSAFMPEFLRHDFCLPLFSFVSKNISLSLFLFLNGTQQPMRFSLHPGFTQQKTPQSHGSDPNKVFGCQATKERQDPAQGAKKPPPGGDCNTVKGLQGRQVSFPV